MFIPHSPKETEEMLQTIGAKSLEELFDSVPKAYRFPKLNLPPSLTEMEVSEHLAEMADANESTHELISFLGAGAYNHYVPAAVDSLLRRSEFYTAYTPYQPEVSQGTLQAIFEYQSLISNLTGMDAANASHYDGATAAAEAAVLAYHHFREKKSRFVLAPSVNPQYREVLRTYMCGYPGIEFVGDEKGDAFEPLEALESLIDANTALVLIQYPDFFGRITDFSKFAEKVHQSGALLAVCANPIALAFLKTPGEMGADIVVGEGQPLGIPLSFGGPYLGFFAVKMELIRKVAGRLVGESVDGQGKRGYVLTLTAREQHIRREKATSNICTNQGLMALAATIYVSLLGKNGLRQVSELCYHRAHYAADRISKIPGYSIVTNGDFFHEFVVKCPRPVSAIADHLLDHGILPGYDLSQDYQGLTDHLLVAVTEMNSKDDIDLLCEALEEQSHD